MAGLEAVLDINCYTRQWRSVAAATQPRWCYLQVCASVVTSRNTVSMLSVLAAISVHHFCKTVCSAGYMFCGEISHYDA